jgi:tetratricopeptide (TPR) repeat protein
MAVSGDSSRSEALANDLEKRFPEDTLVRFSYLPVLRACVALNRHQTTEALEALQFAVPNEWGVTPTGFGALYPIYVRGQVYRAAQQGAQAAAEFQKILDHRGIVQLDLIGVLAHLQLGRAFALMGDQRRAKAAYEEFLTFWKEADPDLPVLQQAKAEYGQLRE